MSARSWRLAAVLALAVVVAVVAIVLSSGSRSTTLPNWNDNGPGTSLGVAAILRGARQAGNVLGRPGAPVTLYYFGDLECPICAEFSTETLPRLVADFVRTGELKIEYLSLQTATRSTPTFLSQQAAAYAAGRQDRAWDFIELFYSEQGEEDSGYVTPHYLEGIASQIPGLDVARWSIDRFDPSLAAEVQADARSFAALGLPVQTPTLLVRGPRGEKGIQAAASEAQMAQLIASVA